MPLMRKYIKHKKVVRLFVLLMSRKLAPVYENNVALNFSF